jgi:hypothetical protein
MGSAQAQLAQVVKFQLEQEFDDLRQLLPVARVSPTRAGLVGSVKLMIY